MDHAIETCPLCQRFLKLLGQYPSQRGAKDMVANLTDEQVARVLTLCASIARIKQELPAPPPGYIVDVEIAKHLRKSLEERNDILLELGALLR